MHPRPNQPPSCLGSRLIGIAVGLAAALLPAASARGQAFGIELPPAEPAAEPSATDLVTARVFPMGTAIRPGGSVTLAVDLEIAPEWHVYWSNPGDAGAPTEIFVDAPDGFTVGPTRFPRPQTFQEPEGVTYGYAERTVLFVELTAPDRALPEAIPVRLDVHFLVCKERCLIGHWPLELVLASSDVASPPPGIATAPGPADVDLFVTYRGRVPTAVPAAEVDFENGGSFLRRDGFRFGLGGTPARRELHAIVPSKGFTEVEFFPAAVPGVTFGAARVTPRGDVLEIAIPVELEPHNALGPMALRGVIGLGSSVSGPAYAFDFPIAEPGT